MMGLLVGLLVLWLILVVVSYAYNLLVAPALGRPAVIAPLDIVLLMLIIAGVLALLNYFDYWSKFTF